MTILRTETIIIDEIYCAEHRKFLVLYLFMIRPQMKRQKDLRKYRESLQKGDKVVTTGGIYGKINAIKDNHIIVEIDDNVKIKAIFFLSISIVIIKIKIKEKL